MKLTDVMLPEEYVISSWIEDLEYDEDQNGVIMTLHNGRSYIIHNFPYDGYEDWLEALSKGRFWHEYIKDEYVVHRLT